MALSRITRKVNSKAVAQTLNCNCLTLYRLRRDLECRSPLSRFTMASDFTLPMSPSQMETDEAFDKYLTWSRHMEQLFHDEEDHDKIMEYVATTGVTSEGIRELYSNWAYEAEVTSTPLNWAVKYGRLDVMNSLIQKGFDPHSEYTMIYEDEDEWFYLIHTACWSGKSEIIKALVEEHKVNVNATTYNNVTVLEALTGAEMAPAEIMELVRCLIKNDLCVKNEDLAYCVRKMHGVAELLISSQTKLDLSQRLMYAAENRDLPFAKLLVEGGASIEGLEGKKLLLLGVVDNNLEMVMYCCSVGIDPETVDKFKPALHFAVEYEAYEVSRYLVVDVNVSPGGNGLEGKTVFERGFRKKNVHFVELLIKAGHDVSKESCLREHHEDEDLEELTQKVLDSVSRRTLADLCVFQVRCSLERNVKQKIQQLPLPSSMQELLHLDHITQNLSTGKLQSGLMERRMWATGKIADGDIEAFADLSLISSSVS